MQEHTHDEKCLIVKPRTIGATTLTSVEQLQQQLQQLIKTVPLTFEQILEKRKLRLQENTKKRRSRKSIRNRALAVAKSKHDRRRISRGATAQELETMIVVTPHIRARTLRREEARKMDKLAKKYSTKQVEPSVPAGTIDVA